VRIFFRYEALGAMLMKVIISFVSVQAPGPMDSESCRSSSCWRACISPSSSHYC